MNRTWLRGSVAGLALLLAAPQAGARMVYVTYQGFVSHGTDLGGLFGPAAGALDGKAFTLRFQLDDSVVDPSLPPRTPDYDWFTSGGGGGDTPNASIAIDHHAFGFWTSGVDFAEITHHNSAVDRWGVSSGVSMFAVDYSPAPGNPRVWSQSASAFLTSTTDPFVSDFDYHATLFHALQAGDTSGGSLSIFEEHNSGFPDHFLVEDVSADLVPLSVSVGIPEPATWMAMIFGFGLLGVAMRWRLRPAGSLSVRRRNSAML